MKKKTPLVYMQVVEILELFMQGFIIRQIL